MVSSVETFNRLTYLEYAFKRQYYIGKVRYLVSNVIYLPTQ